MRNICLLLVAVLSQLPSLPLHAQSDFDGDFWITKTDVVKLTYVLGFVDGWNEGINDAAEAVGTDLRGPKDFQVGFGSNCQANRRWS
jgi:hypothetical protein